LESMFLDAEGPDLPFQRRGGEAESHRRTGWSGDAPATLGESRLDDLPLARGQLLGEQMRRRGRGLARGPAWGDDERGAAAHDPPARDDVLELADVAGPAIGLDEVHGVPVDLPDGLAGLARVAVDEVRN